MDHPALKWLAVAATLAGIFAFLWGILAAEQEQVRLADINLLFQEDWKAADKDWNETQIRQQQQILTQQEVIRTQHDAIKWTIRKLEADHDKMEAVLRDLEQQLAPGRLP